LPDQNGHRLPNQEQRCVTGAAPATYLIARTLSLV
jgi:hypothetical protein